MLLDDKFIIDDGGGCRRGVEEEDRACCRLPLTLYCKELVVHHATVKVLASKR